MQKIELVKAAGAALVLMGAVVSGVARADDSTGAAPVRMAEADVRWLATTAQDGMTEVRLSDYAQNHASNADVKQFAAHMVTDHSQANEELRTLTAQKNVSLEATLDAKHQALVDALEKTPDAQLDAAYMRQMLADHKLTVHRFSVEQTAARDNDVRAWVKKTLPVLQGHLEMAKKVARETRGKVAVNE